MSEGIKADQFPYCGDSSCRFRRYHEEINGKGGQHTNGGCRCLNDLTTDKRHFVHRLHHFYEEMKAENAALKRELEAARKVVAAVKKDVECPCHDPFGDEKPICSRASHAIARQDVFHFFHEYEKAGFE